MKDKIRNWVIGIGCGKRQYRINNVTYTVSSHFEPAKSDNRIKDRLARTIVSDFAQLTLLKTTDKIIDGYVCSAAGEEDNYAVEKEN